ncbi:MAG: response regulator transcription factor [Candidatus Aminicenantes bacterium]|nr:response regulator transcription factor [Candidatus Aminicenantes bacterium]
METINVILADAYVMVREGLCRILCRDPRIAVQGEADNAEEFFHLLAERPCDVAVVDTSLFLRNGNDILPRLKKKHRRTAVLVTSSQSGENPAVRAFRLGADGYIWKGQATGDFLEAVLSLAGGHKFIGRELALRLSFNPKTLSGASAEDLLSERELQVLKLIAGGLSMTDIAGRLGIDIRTASTYRRRVLSKMNLPTNAALIAYALNEHLVS